MAISRTTLAMIVLTGVLALMFCAFVLPTRPEEVAGEGRYTQAELDYFSDICGATYELGGDVPLIKKWDGDLRINVTGRPDASDRSALNRAIGELNQITGGVELTLDDRDPNVVVYVGPASRFGNYLPFVSEAGGFNVWNRNGSMIIDRAAIAIDSGEDAGERAFQIAYAMAVILGCPGRSTRYPDSIFYSPSGRTAVYSDMDRAVIRMLYDGRVEAGMTTEQARAALIQ